VSSYGSCEKPGGFNPSPLERRCCFANRQLILSFKSSPQMDNILIIQEDRLRPLLKDILRELLEESPGFAVAVSKQPPAPPITQKELCQFLGVSVPTVIRWRKKGKIPFKLIGGLPRYDKADVLAALESKPRR
jgi:excisionase family DNA binding protein